jgi:hypothetical protein
MGTEYKWVAFLGVAGEYKGFKKKEREKKKEVKK